MHHGPLNPSLPQNPLQGIPVNRTLCYTPKRGACPPVLNFPNTLIQGTCRLEDLWVCHDANKFVDALPNSTPGPATSRKLVQCRDSLQMKWRFAAMGINQNIGVNRNHSGSLPGLVISSISEKLRAGATSPPTIV